MELLGGFFAERFDVHGVPGSEMRDPGDDLRLAAQPIVTEQMGAALFQRRAAGRANLRIRDLLAIGFVRHLAEDFRNDVVGTADEHPGAQGKL
ncbi:hypothetical protein D3C81_1081790 [compost metagenome]